MVQTYVKRAGNVITALNQKLEWWAAYRVHDALKTVVFHDGYEDVTLDLTRVTAFYPNGILPILADIDTLRTRHSIRFQVRPPSDAPALSLAARLGYLHYLDPESHPIGVDGHKSLAVHRYTNADELNPVINRVLDISMQQLQFAQGVLDALGWALNEIAGNVLDYAEAPGWIQLVTHSDRVIFGVCDAGVGVPATIKRVFTVHSDKDALAIAVKAGIRKSPRGQGNGLAGCLSIAKESKGIFQLASGTASLYFADSERLKNYDYSYDGTFVGMQLPTAFPINIEKALWGHRPAMKQTELLYGGAEGELVCRLRDYASNFGNRATGEKIRNVVYNMLNDNPGMRVRIVFDDVPLISSSFADELIGKLVEELGIVDFNSHITLQGLNSVCKKIIDRVIRQRLAQSYLERGDSGDPK